MTISERSSHQQLPWSAGRWTHAPVSAVAEGEDLVVTAAENSDAWRLTSYGFIHDSEHALLDSFRWALPSR